MYANINLTSSLLPILVLLRNLVLRCLQHTIEFKAKHEPGEENVVADSFLFPVGLFHGLPPSVGQGGVPLPSLPVGPGDAQLTSLLQNSLAACT